jgi:hypothetical protein
MFHYLRIFSFIVLTATCCLSESFAGGGGGHSSSDLVFPMTLESYEPLEAAKADEAGKELNLWEVLVLRASADPINLVATLLFLGAILHTFAAGNFMKLAHKYEAANKLRSQADSRRYVRGKDRVCMKATLYHFLGEVEAIFGIWLVPLLGFIVFQYGWGHATHYIDTRNYIEPMFVVVIMAIASSRPVVAFAGNSLSMLAGLGKRTPAAWWLSILIVAPLLGSFITEPAAMTIAALLLGQQFFVHKPEATFKYATLGLLFVNISVGGTLTHFAAPPVLMVASKWEWGIVHMFTNFGWRAVLGILAATAIYYLIFRKQFAALSEKAELAKANHTEEPEEPVPTWLVLVHLGFLAWTVFTLHHPAFFIGGFLFFMAFTMATDHHQEAIQLKSPILVGFFLAGLVTHGGLQGWWIAPVLSSLSELPLFIGATTLTAFNDNAAITFLAAQVPDFDQHMAEDTARALRLQYAVVAGAVTGGGLTVIANAPNPAGQSLLSKFFDGGISPFKLLLGALFPTLVMAVFFILLPH